MDSAWEYSVADSGKSKQRRGGLGRGLGSLIPTAPPEADLTDATDTGGMLQAAIDAIQPNPWQPRLSMRQEQLDELVASIRTHGVMQPLVVSPADSSGTYTLIAGERRWRAATLAGLEQVPVVVLEASPQAMLELAIVENVVRADLSPLEEAHAYRRLIEDFHLTQGEVAERVGKSRVAVTNTLRLLNAPEQVQQALVNGEITEGHARALLGTGSLTDQIAMLDEVLRKSLNVRQTENLVRSWAKAPVQKEFTKPEIDPDTVRIEGRLRSALNTRVSLKRAANQSGSITIEFYSDEQLQAIYDRLVDEELW
ncbi:MAG: ParB/RepB/Spo0J family partition protein [Thermomicrobiales bacterium]|nr:ParB/RepB/Spo0J family partition protein [Thermomicrobiales bacterium]